MSVGGEWGVADDDGRLDGWWGWDGMEWGADRNDETRDRERWAGWVGGKWGVDL